MSTKSPTINLVARDLADADAHLVEALELVNGRVPGYVTDKLIAVSDYLWVLHREPAPADDALSRVKVIQCARGGEFNPPYGSRRDWESGWKAGHKAGVAS